MSGGIRFAGAVGLLVVVYGLTLASFHPWDVALGALVAVGVLVAFRGFLPIPGAPAGLALARRAVAFWPFAWVVVLDIVRGTWKMALIVLHARPLAHPGIIVVPIGERSPLGVAVFGLATTLSPGSVLIDVDWEAGVMLMHVIDASDPDRVRSDFQRFYDRWQRHVFP